MQDLLTSGIIWQRSRTVTLRSYINASSTFAVISSETNGLLEHFSSWTSSVIRTWLEKQMRAPSLLVAKPKLSVADSSPGREEANQHASVAKSRVTALL
ncbi:hypothetical protein NPIL_547431 [Nephila pilipes]|uniref:Uncharacterized protein n=1 Tax=Nephila pilipes TaxID=299642 RepID=A0A8X6MFI1_NEPPI|nr:hypothetical protein NPIL_547431 [Nephila pilipes]